MRGIRQAVSEQRGENNNDVDDDKSVSYWNINTALWFAQINNVKTHGYFKNVMNISSGMFVFKHTHILLEATSRFLIIFLPIQKNLSYSKKTI